MPLSPWITHAEARAPDGTAITLHQRGADWFIRADGRDLMSSRKHGSEEEMARLARAERPDARVLVGGLGMGFTLAAALEALPPGGRVTVAELVPAVVDWNRGPLGPLAGHPLEDPRVDVVVGDVSGVLAAEAGRWDVILLDVDNGPESFTVSGNAGLYGPAGLAAARRALRPGGVVAYWSAFESPSFPGRLTRAGFRAEIHPARAHRGRGGRHVLYLGRA